LAGSLINLKDENLIELQVMQLVKNTIVYNCYLLRKLAILGIAAMVTISSYFSKCRFNKSFTALQLLNGASPMKLHIGLLPATKIKNQPGYNLTF